MNTKIKSTFTQFKRLVGRKFRDPVVQDEIKRLPYNITEGPDGDIGVKVSDLVC